MKQSHFNERVAGEIRAVLGRKKISQQELASRLGWAPSQLSRRLSGLIPFSTDEVERIARALDIPLHELVSPPFARAAS